MTDSHLLALAVLAAAVPIVITIRGLYGVHRRMDTVAHATAGLSLGALGLVLFEYRLVAVAAVFAIALAWEWVEPRIPWVDHVGHQDTEADIAVGTLAAAVLALLV